MTYRLWPRFFPAAVFHLFSPDAPEKKVPKSKGRKCGNISSLTSDMPDKYIELGTAESDHRKNSKISSSFSPSAPAAPEEESLFSLPV